MFFSGTDPESYITDYTLVYEEYSSELKGSGSEFMVAKNLQPDSTTVLFLITLKPRVE